MFVDHNTQMKAAGSQFPVVGIHPLGKLTDAIHRFASGQPGEHRAVRAGDRHRIAHGSTTLSNQRCHRHAFRQPDPHHAPRSNCGAFQQERERPAPHRRRQTTQHLQLGRPLSKAGEQPGDGKTLGIAHHHQVAGGIHQFRGARHDDAGIGRRQVKGHRLDRLAQARRPHRQRGAALHLPGAGECARGCRAHADAGRQQRVDGPQGRLGRGDLVAGTENEHHVGGRTRAEQI